MGCSARRPALFSSVRRPSRLPKQGDRTACNLPCGHRRVHMYSGRGSHKTSEY